MTKQRKINSTYAIVMVIGLAFMLLFGYLVKPFSTVTVMKAPGCFACSPSP